MLFTLQLISKLTGIPLNPKVSGTGIIKSDGRIRSAEFVKLKSNAAAKVGCKVFLHTLTFKFIIRMNSRTTLEHKLGKLLYSSSIYEKETAASMYLFNHGRRREDDNVMRRVISMMIVFPFVNIQRKRKP